MGADRAQASAFNIKKERFFRIQAVCGQVTLIAYGIILFYNHTGIIAQTALLKQKKRGNCCYGSPRSSPHLRLSPAYLRFSGV